MEKLLTLQEWMREYAKFAQEQGLNVEDALLAAATMYTSLGAIRVMKRKKKRPVFRARIVDGKGNIVCQCAGTLEVLGRIAKTRKFTTLEIEDVDGKWREMTVKKPSGCEYCFGYGVFSSEEYSPDYIVPLNQEDAERGEFSEPCPKCSSDNYYYSSKKKNTNKKLLERISSKNDSEKFDDFMNEFAERIKCAESSEP